MTSESIKASTTRVALRRDHKTAAAFIDETGAIAQDRFFSVGCLVMPVPSAVLRQVQKLRDKRQWYGEIKWVDLTMTSLPLYKDLVDLIVKSDSRFYCFVADRQTADPVARFSRDTWLAYEKLATQVLIGAAKPFELLSVMADNYSTPDKVKFEEDGPGGGQSSPRTYGGHNDLSDGLEGLRRASACGCSDGCCHV